MKKSSTTNSLTNSVVEYLLLLGWQVVFRQNNHAVYDQKRRCYRKKSKYDRNGIADVVALQPNGPSWWIEVKTDKDRMSADQLAFKKDVEESGHIYIECRCLNYLIRELEVRGIKTI